VALLLVFFVWLFGSVRGRGLGESACESYPLLILLVDSAKTPNLAALLLLALMMMKVQLLGQFNFTVG
jgi:hypothetical protein